MNTQTLKVSLSTDAVIYLPFYLAYFGGVFSDTPYGAVDVKIVGLEDPLFNSEDEQKVKSKAKHPLKPRLRGDVAMTMDLLLDVADIGIGDPGFGCMLRTEKKDLYKKYFNRTFLRNYIQYFDLKQFDASSCIRMLDHILNNHYDQIPEFISDILNGKEDVKKKKDIRILSGLIRKPGLKAITGQSKEEFFATNQRLNETEHKEKDLLRNQSVKFTQNYSVFTYPTPATSAQYVEKNLRRAIAEKHFDFGVELQNLKADEICLSCDFIALDYLHEKENSRNYIIDDLVTDNDRLMWSGFMADYNKYKADKNKYKAFVYAIDKVLHEFNLYIEARDRLGLEKYIYNMLNKDHSNNAYIISVLIADSQIAKDFTKEMTNPLMQITRQIADNIFRWRGKTISMYYASSMILSNAAIENARRDKHYDSLLLFDNQNFAEYEEIKAILKLRDSAEFQDTAIDHLVFPDLLKEWRKTEKRVVWVRVWFKWVFSLLYNNNFWESIAIFFAFLGLLSFINGLFDPIFSEVDKVYELYILGFLGLIGVFLLLLKLITRKHKYVYHHK